MSGVLKGVALSLVAALIAAGCAGLSKGPSDEELIRQTLSNMKTSLETKDREMFMAVLSPSFNHPQVGGKEEIAGLIDMALNSGYLDEGQISMDNIEIKIDAEKGTATAYPLDLSGPPGSISVEVVLGKEADGQWLVTTVNPDGM